MCVTNLRNFKEVFHTAWKSYISETSRNWHVKIAGITSTKIGQLLFLSDENRTGLAFVISWHVVPDLHVLKCTDPDPEGLACTATF